MKKMLLTAKTPSWFMTMILSCLVFPLHLSFAFSQGINAGTYTIGGVTPDYATFNDAVTYLNTNGLAGNGPVIFNVRDGVYSEQIMITDISNASASSYVVFKSESNDSTLVQIMHIVSGAGDNYTVFLNGADYVTFEKLTIVSTGTSYGRAVVIEDSSFNNTFKNDIIQGKVAPASSSLDFATVYITGQTDYISFTNNRIKDGSYGIYMLGDVSPKNIATVITDNEFNNGYSNGVYVKFADAPIISNNIITTGSTFNSFWGITVSYCYNDLRIEKNRISGGQGGYGINLEQFNIATAGFRGRVANNMVQIGASTYVKTGIYVGSGSEYQDICHNSVNVTSSIAGTDPSNFKACYIGGGTNIRLLNNVFANSCLVGGYAIYIPNTGAVSQCDYNYYYTSSLCKYSSTWLSNMGKWGVTNCENLAEWQIATGMDANSRSNIDPVFVSPTDLHSNSEYLDNAGMDLTSFISDDIDGDIRPITPCMGADEFASSNPPYPGPLTAGTYTVGGVTPDYLTVNDAVQDMVAGGISGNVVIEIRPGTYNEQVWIKPLFLRAAGATITIQSSTGNPADVILTNAASGAGDNYTLKIDALDYVSVKDITIQATDATYGRAVVLTCATDNTNFINNVIQSAGTASTECEAFFSGGWMTNTHLSFNTIQGGYYGYFYNGLYSGIILNEDNPGHSFTDNEFINNIYGGISLRYIDAPEISRNIFTTNSTSGYRAINLHFVSNDFKVEKNQISGAQRSFGIFLEGCVQGQAASRGVISNNFVQLGASTYSKTGIYIGTANAASQFIDIFHNSVNITGTQSGKSIDVGSNCNNIRIKNNIFANNCTSSTSCYTMYIGNGSAISESDNNDLYKSYSGGNLAYWGADQVDLAAWQLAASPFEASSVSTDPVWLSTNDLHLTISSPLSLQAGQNLMASVPDDIDIEARTPIPWMGADEYDGIPVLVEEISSISMSLFPNPASETVNFSIFSPESASVQISIYTLTGQKILEQSSEIYAGITLIHVDINKLPAGYYLTKVISDIEANTLQRKLIKY